MAMLVPRLAATAEASRAPRRPRERLQAAVQLVVDSTDVAFAAIQLTEIGEHYVASGGPIPVIRPGGGSTFASAVIALGATVIVGDVRRDPRFAELYSVVSAPHLRAYAGALIRGRDGRVVGVCSQYWTHPISGGAEYRETIELLAAWAGDEFTAATAENAAERVQRALRPRAVAPVPGYELAGNCVPALQIGGDFYDWHAIPDGLVLTLGDVMGKGVGAGILAATLRASLHASNDADDPADSVRVTDRVLLSDFEATESFATLFHAHLRPDDGSVRFVDAGHRLTIVAPRQGDVIRLTSSNLPLGSVGTQRWESQEVVLQPGDTLVSVSDGVLDLYDGTLASLEAVGEITRTSATAQEIVDRLSALAKARSAPDDVTTVALRRAPK